MNRFSRVQLLIIIAVAVTCVAAAVVSLRREVPEPVDGWKIASTVVPDPAFGGVTVTYGGCIVQCFDDEITVSPQGMLEHREYTRAGEQVRATRVQLTRAQLAAIAAAVDGPAHESPEPPVCCDIPTWKLSGTWDGRSWSAESTTVPAVLQLARADAATARRRDEAQRPRPRPA